MMDDDRRQWDEPTFSTVSAAQAWALFCGILAAALGWTLYWMLWLLREILG